MKRNLTLRQTSRIMEQNPNKGSQKVILSKWLTTLAIASMNESLLPLKPSKVPNWDVPIIMAAALVNPDITGMLTNSTRNPKWSSPIRNITQPVRKHKSTWEAKRFVHFDNGKLLSSFLFQNFIFSLKNSSMPLFHSIKSIVNFQNFLIMKKLINFNPSFLKIPRIGFVHFLERNVQLEHGDSWKSYGKVALTAISSPSLITCCCDSKAIIAVGPTVISLQLPNTK